MTTPTANDTRSQIDTIWNALHSHRENCIPEGTPVGSGVVRNNAGTNQDRTPKEEHALNYC